MIFFGKSRIFQRFFFELMIFFLENDQTCLGVITGCFDSFFFWVVNFPPQKTTQKKTTKKKNKGKKQPKKTTQKLTTQKNNPKKFFEKFFEKINKIF